ncbi:MAG: 5-oxoprolinase subunit PxpA, partial [Pseudomonadota bacterium]
VASANIACGFHGGDPSVMRRVMLAAEEAGVSLGAHPGFNDLWGFGRRRIQMRSDELEYQVAYQIGAAMGMAAYTGQKITHVKAHGALNNMACVDRAYADAIARAVKTVDPKLIHVVMPATEMEAATRAVDLPIALEAFADRTYEADGTLTPRSMPGSVLKDPAAVAERALRMTLDQEIVARTGERMALGFDTLCLHGDEPTAVAVATAVRRSFEEAGIEIVTLPELIPG